MEALPDHTGIRFTATHHSQIPQNLIPSSQTLPSPFVVCITGASRGIGAAFALAFAQAGATGIIITARKVESLDETKRQCLEAAKFKELRVTCLAASAGSDESAAENIAASIEKEHGRLDLFVNNAGILSTDSTAFNKTQDINATNIQGTIESNYLGRFLAIKHALPLLLNSPNGAKAIINVSSIGSHLVKNGAMGYSISALATNRLTEWVAGAYADQGIVAYSIHPGAVKNDVPPAGMPAWILEASKDDPALCGAFCVWLVKEKREWLSGRFMIANWDVEELEAKKAEIVEGDKLKFRMAV